MSLESVCKLIQSVNDFQIVQYADITDIYCFYVWINDHLPHLNPLHFILFRFISFAKIILNHICRYRIKIDCYYSMEKDFTFAE